MHGARPVRAPGPRADLAVLDAPSHTHLAYRPGVPLRHALELGHAHPSVPIR